MSLKNKHFLNVPFEVKQINNEDPDNFVFEGYASTFGNVDLGDDIVQQGAFLESLKSNPIVPILWQHKMGEPLGVSIELREDNKGLFVKATLPKGDTMVSGRVIPQMKIGSIKEMSIGFFIRESSFNTDTNIRTLEKIGLFEISLVTKAMNPQATVNDFKSFKEIEIRSLKDIETFLKEGGLSQNEAKTLISNVKEFSNQRDAEEKQKDQRDAEEKKRIEAEKMLVASMNKLTNNLNKFNNDNRNN
jgi:HK97 family phage prohead protease